MEKDERQTLIQNQKTQTAKSFGIVKSHNMSYSASIAQLIFKSQQHIVETDGCLFD